MAKDKERDEDDFSEDEMGEGEDEDAPVFDEDDEEAPFDEEDPDEEDDEDALVPARVGRVAKRVPVRQTQTVAGVPRPKLEDPKVAAELWDRLKEGMRDTTPTPYAVSGKFTTDEPVDHKTFGLGFVIGIPAGNKMEVLFRDGVRKLVQGR